MKKGIINFLEFVFVAISLFIAFGIFFPRFSYVNRWEEANLLVTGRDIILTSDRLKTLYNFSFNATTFTNLTETLLPRANNNILFWTETENAIKNATIVACNCSQQMVDNLNSWFNGLRFNGREVRVLVVQTSLEDINNPSKTSDVLFIQGYKSLDSYYSTILEFISQQKGIVEMMDFSSQNQVDNDRVQQSVFGLVWNNNPPNSYVGYDEFTRKPNNSSDTIYQSFQLFHHIPVPILLASNTTIFIPTEGGLPSCNNKGQNFLKLGNITYGFWLCSNGAAYFDTDRNGLADIIVFPKGTFNITNLGDTLNFTLSYTTSQKIGISFQWKYRMEDIVRTTKDVPANPPGNAFGLYYTSDVDVIDGNRERILFQANQIIHGNHVPIPAVILNATAVSKAAYIADFTNDRDVVGDDHRLLLMSLLLWASNKHSVSSTALNLKTGRVTSYINIANDDIFEVYKLNFGVGRPF